MAGGGQRAGVPSGRPRRGAARARGSGSPSDGAGLDGDTRVRLAPARRPGAPPPAAADRSSPDGSPAPDAPADGRGAALAAHGETQRSTESGVKHLVVGTAGHIDHGKSALVRALTGIDPDRLREEKARGITIDLGFARYQEGATGLAFVDVPGHERFVRNMLAGVSGIDSVVLVVAADESVMPQTREHFDICRLLDVADGVVALTKADLVDAETIELVRLEVSELVAGSFLEGAPVVPVSSRTGEGLDSLRRVLAELADGAAGRRDDGIPRLPIDRAFSMKGFGTVVTGTLVSGRIDRDADLFLLPGARRVKVRGLEVHGRAQPSAHAGQRAAINLAGVGVDDLRRGDTLTVAGGLLATRRIDARVSLLDDARALRYGARVRFHQGTTEVMARVALGALSAPEDGDVDGGTDGPPLFPGTLDPGSSAFARLHLERPAALTRGDRFVLRAYSPPLTIGGGVVLDPDPPRGRLRSAAGAGRLRRLDRMDGDGLRQAVELRVDEAGGAGVTAEDLAPRVGLTQSAVTKVLGALVAGRAVTAADNCFFATERVMSARAMLLDAVTAYHRKAPLEPGLPREMARSGLGTLAGPELFDHVAEALATEGVLAAGRHLALSSHRVVLSEEEARLKDRLAARFREEGLSPPDVVSLPELLGADREAIDRMIALLVREGILERLGPLLFHRDVLDVVRTEVGALKASAPAGETARVDIAWFKSRFGITRKYAIPLLEHLDRARITRRVGTGRIVV
ncbi:MAG: selenocysteine-specific translation elongation factor [Acidobacteria bacterium]|nr:selenocysteine-specific translation elongation factor [Acidobacteriota bacterium]MYJ02798.1 selenocysteine-specific translation elongation factor [Acidobacteriota bacterium]